MCIKTLTNESIPDASSAQLHARLCPAPADWEALCSAFIMEPPCVKRQEE